MWYILHTPNLDPPNFEALGMFYTCPALILQSFGAWGMLYIYTCPLGHVVHWGTCPILSHPEGRILFSWACPFLTTFPLL